MFHYEFKSLRQFQASGDSCSTEFIFQPGYGPEWQYYDYRIAIRQKWCDIHYV